MMGAPIHNVAYLYERKLSFTLLHLHQGVVSSLVLLLGAAKVRDTLNKLSH